MSGEVRGRARDTPTPEVCRGCTNYDGRLHELSYNETLRLLMLSAPLACASGADQDIDALVSYFGRVIDAEQDEPNLGMPILERRDGVQQHPPAKGWPQTDSELPVLCGIGLKSGNRFLERPQHLGSVSIETRAFGR